MTQRENISAELRELSPVVAKVPITNVYKVPEGYFDALAIECLMAVCPPASFFGNTVPEGYFNNLPSIILEKVNRAEALHETEAISSVVAGIGNRNILSVPEQYFETLPAAILANILLNTTSSKEVSEQVYKVPEGYFTSLPNEILSRIKNNIEDDVTVETQAVSTLVAGIGNKNVYGLPKDYFDDLASGIVTKATKPAAKVVNMKGRFGAFKYAAAAAVAGLIAFSLFFMLNNNEPVQNGTTAATMAAAEKIINTNSFELEMNQVSDQAIVSFLESKGEDVEAALVASLADDKNLPDITDYLIDDKALDEILQTVTISN